MLNYTKIYITLSIITGINLFFGFLPKFILFPLGAAFFLLAAYAYGKKKYPDAGLLQKLSFGTINLLVVAAITGAIFFYLFSLGKAAIITILLIIFWQTRKTELKFTKPGFQKLRAYSLQFAVLLMFAALFLTVFYSASDGLIKSPWSALPSYFLPLFFLASCLVIFLIYKKGKDWPAALYFFLFFSVAAIVYKLGYGFDQFIHEASQKYILAHGSITPKTLQYIGLYSINIFINQVAGASIAALDRFLLPVLTALIFPIAQYSWQKSGKIKNSLALLALLLLPLSAFIVSTPQGVANLFLLILILAPMQFGSWKLPLAILLIHPITGIIAFVYMALKRLPFKKITAAAGALAIPLAFIALSRQYSGHLQIKFNFLSALKDYGRLLTSNGFAKNYNFLLDLVYLTQYFILPVIIIVAVWAAVKYRKQLSPYPLYLFGIATANFFLTEIFADFSYLISYEQQNYPERIFYISLLFLAPYLIFAAGRAIEFLRERELALKIFFAAASALILTFSFYLSYPRFDNYKNDKGKNLTADMMFAAASVAKDAGSANYVVLTDQAVSAAALKLDGFKKYYSTPLGEIFYYPIPTGGPLYNEFLNLVYNNAGAKSAQNAKILTNASRAYVILPSYWENYKKIKENLLLEMKPIAENENIAVLKY